MFTFNKTSRFFAAALIFGASSLYAADTQVSVTVNTSSGTDTMTVEEQKQYKPSGVAFCIDPNVGLIWDNLDPEFSITYQNAAGQKKVRNYQASIDTVGLKLDVSFRFNLVFFTDSANDYFESNKVLELGQGIEIGDWPLRMLIPGLNLLPVGTGLIYAPFKNAPGGLLIIDLNIGLGGDGLCLVQGGTLTPTK